MSNIRKIVMLGLCVTPLWSVAAYACPPAQVYALTFRYDVKTHKSYVGEGTQQQEIDLKPGFQEIVERGAEKVLRFASDGKHAYVIDEPDVVRPLIGAQDYATLQPIANRSVYETYNRGWRYYRDKYAVYRTDRRQREQVLLIPLSVAEDQSRQAQTVDDEFKTSCHDH